MEGNTRNGTAPPLNEYKIEFLKGRITRTILGGVDLRVKGSVPYTVYIFQLILFIFPAIIGIPFSIITDELNISRYVLPIILGGIMICLMLLLQLISLRLKNKISDIALEAKPAASSLEEEEEYYFESLLSSSAFSFVVPTKSRLVHLLIQCLIGGIISGYTVFYLLPSRLKSEFSLTGGAEYVFLVFGWVTLCVSQYSLTAKPPPEPNQYRSYTYFELDTYSRPFYLIMCFVIDMLAYKKYGESLELGNYIVHIVFLIFPFLWVISILPQIDVFWLWISEQILVFCFGGTATLDDLRLFLMLAYSITGSILVFILYNYTNQTIGIAVAAGFGYLLSVNSVLYYPTKKVHHKHHMWSKLPLTEFKEDTNVLGIFKTSHKIKAVLGVIATLLCGGIAFVLSKLSVFHSYSSSAYAVVFTIVYIILKLCMQLQRPFFFNIIRNPLFVSDSTKRSQSLLSQIITFTFYWLNTISPLIMLTYLSLSMEKINDENLGISFLRTILLLRSFRWIWQNSTAALLELTVFIWLNTQIDDFPLDTRFSLFVFSIIHDRWNNFVSKLYFVLVSMYTAMTHKKLKFGNYKIVFLIEIILFPVILGVILFSSVISAPLLPFLGLPIFIIGFPRPARQWSSAGQSYSASEDSVYYRQMVPEVLEVLPKLLHSGQFGDLAVSSFYIMRFESRMVWMEIVEKGYDFITIVLKGLELQETSCHHTEALKIDELLAHSNLLNESPNATLANHFALNTMSPLTNFPIRTYTKSKMVMTGIIDHPDNLKLMTNTFFKTLLWVFKTSAPQPLPEKWRDLAVNYLDADLVKKFPKAWYYALNPSKDMNTTITKDPVVALTIASYAVVEVYGLGGFNAILAGPKHIYDVFQGNIPNSLESEWIEKDPLLKALIVKAYRYAYKAVFDTVTIAEYENDQEFKDALIDYDKNWYMGNENEEWEQHITQHKENLFALSLQENVYSGHILRLNRNSIQVGKLNTEAVKGIWGALSLELLYITNDDDERYSIQAHPTLLRNITIQSSEPPLGYPTYNTSEIL